MERKTEVSLNVENSVSGTEQPTEPPSNVAKHDSFLRRFIQVPKPFCYLIWCLLFVCFAPVAYVILTVATVTILPLLFTVSVFERLFQFFVKDNYLQRNLSKLLLRYWTFVFVILLLVEVGLFYPIAKYAPGFKVVSAIGLPITKWIEIIFKLSGIYIMKQLILVSLVCIVTGVFAVEFGLRFVRIRDSGYEIMGCLLFLWAEVIVMNSVPTFKQSNIFGICTQKWIEVSVFLLIGYNIITVLTHLFVWSLPEILRHYPGDGEKYNKVLSSVCCDDLAKGAINQKYVVYVTTGIKRSIIFILNMVVLLVTWVVYFGNRLHTTPQYHRVLEFGTWTIVCMLLCSFLWLIKSCILLYWEAHTVYDRLHSKITDTGKQLYFLIMLSHTHYQKLIGSPEVDSDDNDCGSSCSKTPPKKKVGWVLLDMGAEREVCDMLDRKSVRAELINRTGPKASTYDIRKAAQRFLTSQYALSKESIVDDLDHLQFNYPEEDNQELIERLRKIVQVEDEAYFDKDWQMLLELLPDVKTEEEITFQKVKTFMERARNSCMFLTNTFISEREVVNCLDQVMGWIIIGAIFIMWLLVTGLASTKVLVIIASPALAATFIFGDTAKSLFQGLIFVYVVHPFGVGDLCVIDDGQLLEVSRIGIWCTIFSNVRNVGEQHQVIYPNSDLAVKHITNYKTSFNWNDRIEFVCSPETKITVPLKQKIITYLNGRKERFASNCHSVDVLEIGDKVRVVVHIKHKLPETGGWTNFECLKAKEERRFELAIKLHNLVKDLESDAELWNRDSDETRTD